MPPSLIIEGRRIILALNNACIELGSLCILSGTCAATFTFNRGWHDSRKVKRQSTQAHHWFGRGSDPSQRTLGPLHILGQSPSVLVQLLGHGCAGLKIVIHRLKRCRHYFYIFLRYTHIRVSTHAPTCARTYKHVRTEDDEKMEVIQSWDGTLAAIADEREWVNPCHLGRLWHHQYYPHDKFLFADFCSSKFA